AGSGTTLVLDIRPGPLGSDPLALANMNGTLFFAASDGVHGVEPWIILAPLPGGAAAVQAGAAAEEASVPRAAATAFRGVAIAPTGRDGPLADASDGKAPGSSLSQVDQPRHTQQKRRAQRQLVVWLPDEARLSQIAE